jgi:exopolysaccharide production protein ExoZ
VLEFILGMCLALLVRGVRVEEKRAARGPRVRPLGQALGDASYALYLCHPIVMSTFAMLWFAVGLNMRLPAYLGAGVSIGLAIIASIVVYRWFEYPLTAFLQKRIRQSSATRPAGDIGTASQRA